MSVSALHGPSSRVSIWDERPSLREKQAEETSVDFAGQESPASVVATFSPEALAFSRGEAASGDDSDILGETGEPEEVEAGQQEEKPASDQALTDEEQRQVDKLRARDAEVRAHEAAHMAAGGSHVRGGASYSYQQGPDGKQYAVGGEVGIDVSSVPGNPQATIQKMQQVRAAALAPSEPSGADQGVAAKAAQVEAQAREQLAAKNTERVASRYAEAPVSPTGELVNETA